MPLNPKGQSLTEYSLIIGLVVIATILAVTTLGNQIANKYNYILEQYNIGN